MTVRLLARCWGPAGRGATSVPPGFGREKQGVGRGRAFGSRVLASEGENLQVSAKRGENTDALPGGPCVIHGHRLVLQVPQGPSP